MLLGGISDDPLEPAHEDAEKVLRLQPSSVAVVEDTGNDLRAATVTDRVAPNQVARVFPQSPGNSELSQMEKGAQWEMDEEELVPDYGQLLAQDRKGSRTGGPSVAMEVDREDHNGQAERFAEGTGQRSGETNPASASLSVAEGDAAQRSLLSRAITEQVSNVAQSQMAPLFHQLFNRLEPMENRQLRLDEQVQETNRALVAEAQKEIAPG